MRQTARGQGAAATLAQSSLLSREQGLVEVLEPGQQEELAGLPAVLVRSLTERS
jgi:hypothetical protein